MSTHSQSLPPLAVGKRQAAAMIGLSVSTIDNLRREGRLAAVKSGPSAKHRVVFAVDELRRFISENSQAIREA